MARYYKIDPENLKSASKERPVTEARRVLCYIAVRKSGYKCSDVSKACCFGFGNDFYETLDKVFPVSVVSKPILHY